MKAIVFRTGTPNCIPFVQSVAAAGHEILADVIYDVGPNPNLVAEVAESFSGKADFGCYIGALREFHNEWVPVTAVLKRANKAVPMVHFCCDACDPPWWPTLEEYEREDAFRVQVTIDGGQNSPMRKWGLVALTPVDPACFPNSYRPWSARQHLVGFSGGAGHRAEMINQMMGGGMAYRPGGGPYAEMCEFYSQCRAVINFSRTGSAATSHVKGRVLEAALAGALLLEPADSPTAEWFRPGDEFMQYRNVPEAIHVINDVKVAPEKYEMMAARMRSRVIARHSPVAFWNRVLRGARVS